jgi:phosphoribosylglycinamide formyltransferase 1
LTAKPTTKRVRLAVLISGAGSNMLAIAEACTSGQIAADLVLVIADVPEAAGLGRAAALGIPTQLVDRHQFLRTGTADRAAFERALGTAIDTALPDWIILAGFMRVLSPAFVARYAGRMLNIHPSLLPRYKGLNTHQRALEAGDREHGATVHFVSAELDAGPLILQAVVPVLPADTVASLSGRVHAQEHIIYPMVIRWLTQGRLQWNDGRPTMDGETLPAAMRLIAGA